MNKHLIVLGVVVLLVLVVGLSGCNEQEQQANSEVTIQGLLIAATNGSGFCYFAFTENFTFERFVDMLENELESEFSYYLNNTYIIMRNGSLLIDDTTGYIYDATIDGIFKMNDEVSITGVIGTIEDPTATDEILRSIDLISIEMIKDNTPY